MAEHGHPDFRAAVMVGEELGKLLKESKEEQPRDPFGMERVRKAQWRKRLRVDKSFRQAELDRMGVRSLLKAWKNEG